MSHSVLRFLFIALLTIAPISIVSAIDELGQRALSELEASESNMESMLAEIEEEYSDDSLFLAKLHQSQEAWFSYREATWSAMFPRSDDLLYYGSSFYMCSYNYLNRLTLIRIEELSIWIEGVSEGDVCSGSVKRKEIPADSE